MTRFPFFPFFSIISLYAWNALNSFFALFSFERSDLLLDSLLESLSESLSDSLSDDEEEIEGEGERFLWLLFDFFRGGELSLCFLCFSLPLLRYFSWELRCSLSTERDGFIVSWPLFPTEREFAGGSSEAAAPKFFDRAFSFSGKESVFEYAKTSPLEFQAIARGLFPSRYSSSPIFV